MSNIKKKSRDRLTAHERSELMRKIRSKDTGPELLVRRVVYSLGYRYRLHVKNLPGKPDLVFQGRKKVIFVHGCFWHGHDCKAGENQPKSNTNYWIKKLQNNIKRDKKNIKAIKAMGWEVLIIWECELKDLKRLTDKIVSFLN